MGIVKFFKNAFSDMKESAKAQHELDVAELRARHEESRASFAEARRRSSPKAFKEYEAIKRKEAIKRAEERRTAAEERRKKAKDE